jgi:hypothetical protein
MERARSFVSFAKVREAILDIRTQSDSTAHPGPSLSATASIGKRFWNPNHPAPVNSASEQRTVNGER